MIELTDKKIAIEEVLNSVQDLGAGGQVHFIGSIREENHIAGIEYQSYLSLAQKQMEEVVQQAHQQWPLKKISVVHRVGWVPLGEAAVVIAVSSAHRKEAFKACEFIIDRIKEIVPIWKEGGEACCHH